MPHSPQGWLLQAAYRKAIDRMRKNKSESRKVDALRPLTRDEMEDDLDDIPDNRLRLIFTCCHPALEPKSRIALTLRTIGGFSTTEIAALFLDAEPTMSQRLSRAKSKIAAAKIPYVVPGPEAWAERLQSVLAVIYLIFTTGYASGPSTGRDLANEAIFLARLLNRLRPDDAEIEGCLALLMPTHARRHARIDSGGVTVPLAELGRTLWQRDEIDLGLALLDTAMQRRLPGHYHIKATIAACHAAPKVSDWEQIALLYDSPLRLEPSPVVRLNRAVALSEAGWPKEALEALNGLHSALNDYQPYHAARAELLSRNGHIDDSRAAHEAAIALSS
ncbi:MAG: RNA polymerase, partial [Candidatus Devosia euplotis]|nr:RNA polymerase [Candidatus Devosia euplotis]